MRRITLNGMWELLQAGTGTPLPAPVPSCIHTVLLANGQLDDPFYRDNERKQMWIGETDWHYRRVVLVDAEMLTYERVLLRCHGVDTIATITLNGVVIGKTENMFRTYEFDVKPHVMVGENTLTIAIEAPLTYAQRMDAEKGKMGGWVEPMRINSGAWIRKEPCNFGWDWGPKMLTSGIWREVEWVCFDVARLDDVQLLQDHQDGAVSLTVNLSAEVLKKDAPLEAHIAIRFGDEWVADTTISLVDGAGVAQLTIHHPRLWWVAGLGDQPLYDVTITLTHDGQILDTRHQRIGLRTLTLERHLDEWGESFYFACNGVPYFAKGANWIPTSPYPDQFNRATYEQLIRASADVHMNMLRVWGGGVYEDDAFYDLCDQYGISVWQDFMFACGTYPSFDTDFMTNVRAEAQDNVRRIRHHACIALWCGNNEVEQGMSSPLWNYNFSWEDYERLFDVLLADVVAELAPQTAYWAGSPHSPYGDRDDWMNPRWGDSHLWAVWHGKEPFEWYRTRPDRFCSEFGFQSFPQPRIIEEFTLPQDRNITSYVMEHHQRSGIGNSTIIHYLLDWYRLPTSFESTIWLSQILQGMAMKYAVEHWRRNMPCTMGALYWQLNDVWGAPSWSSLDWRGNWKALHFMAKRFYAPLLISGVEDMTAKTIQIHITSDLGKSTPCVVRWHVTDTSGKSLETGEQAVTVMPRANQMVMPLNMETHIATHGARDLLIWLELYLDGVCVSDNLVLLARPKHMTLYDPHIQPAIRAISDTEFDLTLTADAPALWVWLEADMGVFSDNFFHLSTTRPTTVRLITPYSTTQQAVQAGLRVQSLINTY
ncbi:MAG: glycoside hydrolase family 2 protein [bacterium]|nr:glycoside hydrolase family 2 protein [bacterium]